jgi:hypothetical protein
MVISTETILWYLLIIAVVLLLICAGKAGFLGAFIALFVVRGGLDEPKKQKINIAEMDEDNVYDGGADIISDYLNSNITPDPIYDNKTLTMAKMKSASKKLITFELFIDNLVSNSILFINSLKSSTDLALSALRQNKAIVLASIDILEKKYPNSAIVPRNLRDFAKKIDDAIRDAGVATKYGNISREELIARFVSVGSTADLDACKRDLRTLKDGNEASMATLRATNERLREEIRRGLTNSSCESILLDCRNERDRLLREIANSRPTNCDKLNREITELRDIAKLLQDEVNANSGLRAQYEAQITSLREELQNTQSALNDVLNAQFDP